ncbi:MAG: hypothetical protein HY466_04055 [Deltaproteobacteria bacterium]|nr:hypothetical protein [Deltaproteobacteria bacterium]
MKIAQRFEESETSRDELADAYARLSLGNDDPFLSTALRFLEERFAALEKDQEAAFALLEQELQNFDLPLMFGVAGDYLEALGDQERAKGYFERAARQTETAAHHLWYRLKSIEQTPPEKLDAHKEILEEIRSALPQLAIAIETVPLEDGYVSAPAEEAFGTKDQLHTLDALSWGLLHDALLAGDKPDLEAVEHLEEERRALAKARVKETSPLEARLHLKNMIRSAALATMPNGTIETALRSESREQAESQLDQLQKDVRVIEKMVHSHRSATGNDPFSEGLADLNWRLHFDGPLSLDRPQEALRQLAQEVIPEYRYNKTTAWHLEALQKQFPHLFNEEGALKPQVNMLNTELGKLAAARTRSAYWISNNTTREIAAPLGGGVGGAAAGFAIANLPGAMVGGGIGAVLGLGGNTVYNINTPEAREAYRQSLKTGLSRVSERRAYLNKTLWGWSAGFAALGGVFWASPVAIGTDFAIKTAGGAARQVALQGGWRAALGAGSHRALQTLSRPDQLLSRTCSVAENCVAGGIHFARMLATRETVGSGAVQVGRFLKGSFKNIKGGPQGFAARMGAGAALVGSDLFYFGEPLEIDNFTGAFGFAVFMNEGASYFYRTNANGLLVGNLARVLTEWGMQYQQDMPLAQPDPSRMMWASVETATMVFFVKSLVRGSEFLGKFPLGNLLLRGRDAFNSRLPGLRPVLTSITSRGTPRFIGLKPEELKPGNGNGNGNGFAITVTKERMVQLSDGRTFPLQEAPQYRDILHRLGITVEGEGKTTRLIGWKPEYRHEIPLGGRRIAHNEPIDQGTENELWRMGITRNERGRFVSREHMGINYTGAHRNNGNGYVPTFDELTKLLERGTVTVGAKRIPIWRGTARSRPRFSIVGAPLLALQTGAAAWGVNKLVFSRQMRGDSEYQPRQRTTNYVVSELVTHPFIQWPFGYDKVRAQALGRLVGFPVNLGANMFFKTYRDSWPGQVTYFSALNEGRYNDVFENFTDNMTSLEIVPFVFGDATDDVWLWEAPALKEFRRAHDPILRSQDEQKINALASMFKKQAEKERTADLSTVDRRALRLMAAYFQKALASDPEGKGAALEPLRNIRETYPPLFKGLPDLKTDEEWEYFVGQVNRETDPAHDFHLYLD